MEFVRLNEYAIEIEDAGYTKDGYGISSNDMMLVYDNDESKLDNMEEFSVFYTLAYDHRYGYNDTMTILNILGNTMQAFDTCILLNDIPRKDCGSGCRYEHTLFGNSDGEWLVIHDSFYYGHDDFDELSNFTRTIGAIGVRPYVVKGIPDHSFKNGLDGFIDHVVNFKSEMRKKVKLGFGAIETEAHVGDVRYEYEDITIASALRYDPR